MWVSLELAAVSIDFYTHHVCMCSMCFLLLYVWCICNKNNNKKQHFVILYTYILYKETHPTIEWIAGIVCNACIEFESNNENHNTILTKRRLLKCSKPTRNKVKNKHTHTHCTPKSKDFALYKVAIVT